MMQLYLVSELAIIVKKIVCRTLKYGQRGEVYEVNGYTVGVAFNICGLKKRKADEDVKNTEILQQALLVWLHGTLHMLAK